MSEELRNLISDSGAKPSRPLNMQGVLRRGRMIRWQRRLMTASVAMVMGVAAWGAVSQFRREGTQEHGGLAPAGEGAVSTNSQAAYSISNVKVTSQDADSALVEFTLAWETQEFPGIRSCTATVYDSTGRSVGDETLGQVYKMSPDPGTMSVEVPVNGTPASASVGCAERVDDPNGRYDTSGIVVERPSAASQELLVTFDTKWTGASAVPGIAVCEVTVYDNSGAELLRKEATFSTEAESVEDVPLSLSLPADSAARPASANVVCSPLRN